ncbi:GNAT family N-acetyltransferase [Billgrantia kenyensis]|uniref:GNAT family N-acetyltransferase n=1 Tax=Billgrantia kenyensis TaxID=321266 RepID=A0A7W0AE91_9GAMM|nr:GNAT family N-acetyltransferase [Halomonas kenyensis]MBA2779320.1 GNAT family N-acetyltransferase [Halomonas kenyensis]MCG6662532.1 GNAT family N-acetyltransferase [Halomonas kenyensis]
MADNRLAHLGDYEQLFTLYRELNPEDPIPDERTRCAFERILESPGLVIFVAESNRTLLATCYLNIVPNLTRGAQPYALIENVVTRATHRGQGLGKRLIRHVQEYAWSRGCYKIMLLTGSEEPATHAFYRACGFSGDSKHGYIIHAPHSR